MSNIKYNTKAVVTIPAWAEQMHSGVEGQIDTISSPPAAYAFVPLVFRAVNLRAGALSRVPIRVTKMDGDKPAEWPFEVGLRELVWKSEAALLLDGANFIEKIPRAKSGKVGDLKWVNPLSMKVKATRSLDGSQLIQFQQGDAGAKWTLDEMIYMREFSIRDDIGKGNAPANVALNDAALIRYMSRFASRFFETGAMPITVLQIDGIVDADEAKRIEGFFKRAATRIRNAFNVLALGRAIEPKIISQPLKDLAMPDLNSQARHAVSLAFGIPQTMLEDAANFATSQEHRLSFWADTMQPRGEWMAEQFNRQVLNKMGLQMAFAFEEMDVFQADESERAASLQALVTAITTDPATAALAMDVLGYDLTDEQQTALAALVAKPEPEPQEQEEPADEPPAKSAWADDFGRWERKAIRVMKECGSAVCQFDSDSIPMAERQRIENGLPDCKTAEQVRALFAVRPVAETPAPEYKADPGVIELAKSIDRMAEAYVKSLQTTPPPPQPNIHVTLPPITMTANMPEQAVPSVTFSPTIEAKAADQAAPQVVFAPVIQPSEVINQNNVNVDVQPTPIENKFEPDITIQPADVTVQEAPKGKRKVRVKIDRDKNGFISSASGTVEDGQ